MRRTEIALSRPRCDELGDATPVLVIDPMLEAVLEAVLESVLEHL